jgi:hypothetical protein
MEIDLENILNQINMEIREYPKRYTNRKLKEKLLEKYPAFTICLLSKCKDILKCYNLKDLTYRDYKLLSTCQKFSKVLGKDNRNYLPKTISTLKFSDMELSIIVLALRDLETTYRDKDTIKRLIEKLNRIKSLHGIYST